LRGGGARLRPAGSSSRDTAARLRFTEHLIQSAGDLSSVIYHLRENRRRRENQKSHTMLCFVVIVTLLPWLEAGVLWRSKSGQRTGSLKAGPSLRDPKPTSLQGWSAAGALLWALPDTATGSPCWDVPDGHMTLVDLSGSRKNAQHLQHLSPNTVCIYWLLVDAGIDCLV